MTTSIWGSGDVDLVEMVRRLVHVAMTQHDNAGRLAERTCADVIDQSDAMLAHEFTRQSDDVTRVGSAQASQHL